MTLRPVIIVVENFDFFNFNFCDIMFNEFISIFSVIELCTCSNVQIYKTNFLHLDFFIL